MSCIEYLSIHQVFNSIVNWISNHQGSLYLIKHDGSVYLLTIPTDNNGPCVCIPRHTVVARRPLNRPGDRTRSSAEAFPSARTTGRPKLDAIAVARQQQKERRKGEEDTPRTKKNNEMNNPNANRSRAHLQHRWSHFMYPRFGRGTYNDVYIGAVYVHGCDREGWRRYLEGHVFAYHIYYILWCIRKPSRNTTINITVSGMYTRARGLKTPVGREPVCAGRFFCRAPSPPNAFGGNGTLWIPSGVKCRFLLYVDNVNFPLLLNRRAETCFAYPGIRWDPGSANSERVLHRYKFTILCRYQRVKAVPGRAIQNKIKDIKPLGKNGDLNGFFN